ncbi:hypothetical protein COHA_004211 [Chlorella ohadii]|uniref:Expansin-like EG45 domain-containing protein n=1 Tax=Chlorella ohadii TaxID=2649997 RepID=A0AAD5DTB7_9CHLO|nr:hypothetical protein COHA_004211 [Chlorella ohadii]
MGARHNRLPPLLALLALSLTASAADWKQGRASYYGTDGWSIHKGNCGFGYISQDQPAVGKPVAKALEGGPIARKQRQLRIHSCDSSAHALAACPSARSTSLRPARPYLCSRRASPQGWDVAALSDQFPNFAGSCGRCYEVKCDPRWVKDGYGASFDRTSVCYDTGASLLLRIVDEYSNKRWCCGDADHMDISIWAFEKLASTKWGVIAIQYREVPCNYQPPKPAPAISNPTPGEYWSQTDNFMQTGDMSTPKIWNYQQTSTMVQGWQFGDPTGSVSSRASSSASASSDGGSTSTSASSSSGGTGGTAQASSWSSSSGGSSSSASSSASSSSSSSSSWSSSSSSSSGGVHSFGGPPDSDTSGGSAAAPPASPAPAAGSGDKGTVFSGSLQNGWWDASYSAKVTWQAGNFGSSGGNVVCADIYGGGALAVSHAQGGFQGAGGLEFWMKTDGGRPQITINIGGGSRYCTPKPLGQMSVLESRGAWSKFALSLGDFGGSYTSFQGCGGNGWWDLQVVEMKSMIGSSQTVCLDSIRLLPGSSSSRRRAS